MRRRHPVLIVLSVLAAAGLLCAGTLAQTVRPALPHLLCAVRQLPLAPRQPTPSPTATPVPPASCWSTVPAPTLPGYAAVLNDVAGSGASDVWAVGEYIDAGIGHTLILHWDGSTWQRVASPDLVTNGTVNSTTNELNGVAVIGPSDAWAVGYGVSSNVPYETITEHWNGTELADRAQPQQLHTRLLQRPQRRVGHILQRCLGRRWRPHRLRGYCRTLAVDALGRCLLAAPP